jgi:hypothetical protein
MSLFPLVEYTGQCFVQEGSLLNLQTMDHLHAADLTDRFSKLSMNETSEAEIQTEG